MIRLVTVMAAALLLSGAVIGAASADDELAVSRDGQTWSDHLPGSLFDPTSRWVPGDTRTEAFFVRNRAKDRGDLRIEARSTDPDRLLRDGDVVVRVRIEDGPWQQLATDHSLAVDDQTLGAGDRAKITVRASFDPTATNHTQHSSLSLDFRVTLSDATAGGDGDGDDDEGGGLLPDTGTEIAGWMVVLAAIAVGTGTALMRRSSRERREETHGAAS